MKDKDVNKYSKVVSIKKNSKEPSFYTPLEGMFICDECGGMLFVIKVHQNNDLNKPRLCDVECIECGRRLYYQPYDFGSRLNGVDGGRPLV